MSAKELTAGLRDGDLIGMWPDSTLVTAIAANFASVSGVISMGDNGWYVKVSTSGNSLVSLCANTNRPEGKVVKIYPDSYNSYILAVRFYGYIDYEGAWHSGIPLIEVHYYGDNTAPTRGQELQVGGADYKYVKGVTSAGIGKVIAVDEPSGSVAAFH